MKRCEIAIDSRTFEVAVLTDQRQARVQVKVDGEVFASEVRSSAAEPTLAPAANAMGVTKNAPPTAAPSAAPVTTAADGALLAPLPGVIKQVMVEPSQALLVLEAIKMDNVIRASKAGFVEAVHAAEGCQAAHGDALLALG